MAAPLEVDLNNWKGLVDLDEEFKSMLATDPDFFFRGQARADWQLVPSFLRVAEANTLDAEKSLWIEQKLLAEFRLGAHLYLPPAALPQDERDFVTLWMSMQHYGAPTRLLDWTESLYVATYFAVEKELECDGAIWVIHPGSIRAALGLDPKWPGNEEHLATFSREDAASVLHTIRGKYQTDRMGAQQTVQSISPQILARHNTIIETVYPQQDPRYRKIIVPRGLKVEFLSRLRRVNITGRALFPGIDGIGKSIAELLQAEAATLKNARRGTRDEKPS
jgi:hypothetical protein